MDVAGKRWVLSVIALAQQDRATELVLRLGSEGETDVRYQSDGDWHGWAATGPQWSNVISELAGLAGVREGPFPKEGLIYIAYSGIRLRWKVRLTTEGECVLRNVGSELV